MNGKVNGMMSNLGAENVVGLIVGTLCVLLGAWLLGYAARGLSYAVAGVVGLFFVLLGWSAMIIVTEDLTHWRGL